jgi:hypothetical protein
LANDKQFVVPRRFYFTKKVGRNRILQLKFPETIKPASEIQAAAASGSAMDLWGKKVLISKTKRSESPPGFDDVLVLSGDSLSWARQIEFAKIKWNDIFGRRQTVTQGLRDKFRLIEEEQNPGHIIKKPGLRSPQIGAIHSALGHLRMSTEVSTIVMPTGTGKTDCMVGLMALLEPECLLIVVPTDALREQLAEKFLTFGVLPKFGL